MKNLRNRSLIIILFLLIILPSGIVAADNPTELLLQAQERQNLNQDSYLLKMKSIIQDKDKTDTAELKVYIYQGGIKQLITFTVPKRLANNKYLVIDSNTWMYQQGLNRPIRISGRQKLFGDAGIGETVGINYYQNYKITNSTNHNEIYKLDLIAKDKKSAYQQARLWITNDGYLKKVILKALNGTPLKKITYQNYHKINNHQLADLVITNLMQNKERTTKLQYIDIQKKNLPAKAFQPLMMDKFELLINNHK
jgi:hypothetical protein